MIYSTLIDACFLEDIQYYLYVIKKVNSGLAAADSQPTLSQEEVEHRLSN